MFVTNFFLVFKINKLFSSAPPPPLTLSEIHVAIIMINNNAVPQYIEEAI